MQESISQRDFYGKKDMHYMANQSIETPTWEELEHNQHLELLEQMFHAEMMGNIMHMHQAIRQPDAAEFVKAMVKEINAHVEKKHWILIKRSKVPTNADVIPAVWSMRRRRDLTANVTTKYKARLNIHGGKQVYGMNYYETYAPVVTWYTICLVVTMSTLFNLALRQIDFVLAYTQAHFETELYMELPQGIETKYGTSKDYVVKLLANLYGQKQAGRVWNQYLVKNYKVLDSSNQRWMSLYSTTTMLSL